MHGSTHRYLLALGFIAGCLFVGACRDSSFQAIASAVGDALGISFNNSASGLSATDVQGAIDEVEGRVDAVESNGGASPSTKRVLAVNSISSDSSTTITDQWTPGAILAQLPINLPNSEVVGKTFSAVITVQTVSPDQGNPFAPGLAIAGGVLAVELSWEFVPDSVGVNDATVVTGTGTITVSASSNTNETITISGTVPSRASATSGFVTRMLQALSLKVAPTGSTAQGESLNTLELTIGP